MSAGGATMTVVTRPSSSAPLVGRHAQMRALGEALDGARDGRPGTVLLGGDAGSGKTRVVDELAAVARSRGDCVLVGHCIDLGEVGLPYLPFVEVLSSLQAVAADEPVVAAQLAARPSLAGIGGGTRVESDGTTGDDVGRLQQFDAVTTLLAEISREHAPVVLVVEDLHWADPSTRDLLRYLVARSAGQRLLILLTYRVDDLHRRHPLRPLLADLARQPGVERIEVPPFTPAETREFARYVAGPLPEDEVRQVVRRSEGNAFFAEELLEAGPGASGLPESLADVLLARVERLEPHSRHLVQLAAVAGRRVAEPLLEAVLSAEGRSVPGGLDEPLRDAVTHQVLVPDDSGRYAFRHALLGEAVYDDLLPGERVRLHAAFATAIRDTGAAVGSAAELAHHAMASKDLPGALVASLDAADQAARQHAPTEQLGHLERALELWHAVPDAGELTGTTLVRLGLVAAGAAGRAGELARAVALARAAVDLVAAETVGHPWGSPQAVAEAEARHQLAQHLAAADDDDTYTQSRRAVELLLGTADELPSVPPTPEIVVAAAIYARACLWSDRDADTLAWAQWTVKAARLLGLPAIEADALTSLAVLTREDPDETARLLQEARRGAVEAGELGVELRISYNLVANRFYSGDWHGALTEIEAGTQRAVDTGTTWSTWAVEMRVLDVVARYLVGDWDGSVAAGTPLGMTPPDAVAARLNTVGLYVAVGRGTEGALAAAEGVRVDWPQDGQIALVGGGTLTDALTWAGRPRDAVAVATEVTAHLTATWNTYFLGGIWLSALAIAALADTVDGPRVDPSALTTAREEAERWRDGARAAAERGRPRGGRMGPEGTAWLARVEAEHSRLTGEGQVELWTQAVEAFGDVYPYEQARSRRRLAEALLSAGDRAGATTAAASAAGTAQRLGAEPLLSAVMALARRGRLDVPGLRPSGAGLLTGREAEVLALVAEGLTNREVGSRLFISDKTVSVHLSNVMAKLGASSRTEAVSRALRDGVLPG